LSGPFKNSLAYFFKLNIMQASALLKERRKKMKKITMSAVALTAIMGSFSSVSAADGLNILDDLKFDAQIRPRYEMVDDGLNATSNANAITARTKLKVTGNIFGVDGLSASVGVISVNNFGYEDYNWNTSNNYDGLKRYSVVMDPQKAIISNAELNYKIGDTLIHAGRGQVNLDNQRFIGTVGWRQLERSYDSVFVANNSVKNLSILAAWVYGLQGVVDAPTTDTNTVLLHAAYKVADPLTITGYDYMIANIHDTYGLALTGKVAMGPVKLDYRAEYAEQSDPTMEIHDHGADMVDPLTGLWVSKKVDASYYNIDLGANISGVLVGANYEYMSGKSLTDTSATTKTFTTPLATGHKFNGWADMFLATPRGGLIDMNARVGYKAKGFGKLLAVYHEFTADENMLDAYGVQTDDLGSEIDAVYVNKIPGVNGLTGMVKYADFSKGKVAGKDHDVQKFWVQLDYKFSSK